MANTIYGIKYQRITSYDRDSDTKLSYRERKIERNLLLRSKNKTINEYNDSLFKISY